MSKISSFLHQRILPPAEDTFIELTVPRGKRVLALPAVLATADRLHYLEQLVFHELGFDAGDARRVKKLRAEWLPSFTLVNSHPSQLAQLRFTPEFGDYRNSGDRRNTGDYRNIGDLIGTTPVVIGPQYQW
ncbi:hypothetical protein B0H16DRAFT_1718016 [Mycena metata]|uniref:Uncharacterized protein n=1 Tax=Mycena metata TaxID=1033252 RepID=A0AAD7JHY3_9AGAR|nr:hypothetical protein B0H16DRAFT_1718016 [Mycena metata]